MSGGVVIRCDGSPAIGLGHVVRCLALARELQDRHGRAVVFAMRDGSLGMRIVRDAGYRLVPTPRDGDDQVAWMQGAIEDIGADVLVLDARDQVSLDGLRTIRQRAGVRIAVIDDTSDVRLGADDVFFPPVPQTRALSWIGFEGRVHTGWEWVLLRSEFASEPERMPHDQTTVLVTMGGSDPGGSTLRAMRALARVTRPIRCIALLGPGFGHEAELVRLLAPSWPHEVLVVRDGDVRESMLAADLAVLSFGVTAYEAAACALPALHLCLTDDHALSSSAFAEAGLAVSLGRADQVDDDELVQAVDAMLGDPAGRNAMGARGRRLVDGKGAIRIADVIATWR